MVIAAAVTFGIALHETDRKAASNVGRIDANVAAQKATVAELGAELASVRGRLDALESSRALAAGQAADLENKFQELARRADTAALGAQSIATPAGAQSCQGQTFNVAARIVCSKTFHVNGVCGTPQKDMPPQWTDLAWGVVAWEPNPILIVGASVDLNGNGTYLGGFIGNSYTPDPITPLRYALNNGTMVAFHNAMIFPAGSGMPFPVATAEKRFSYAPHLDLHLYCAPNGSTYSGYVFVWYEPQQQQQQQQK